MTYRMLQIAQSAVLQVVVVVVFGLGSYGALTLDTKPKESTTQYQPASTPSTSTPGNGSPRALPEALVPFGESSPLEQLQLEMALSSYRQAAKPEDVQPLTTFLTTHPLSPWRQSLWLNLGDIYYRQGYFSEAMTAWRSAWDSAKSATVFQQRAIADQAMGELVRMHARLGHADEVEALLDELGDRKIIGSASEAVQGAREGLWFMRKEPGVAYLCGPMALRSVLSLEPGQEKHIAFLDSVKSKQHGVSLGEVGALAKKVGMDLVPARRLAKDDIPVPSVVHWRVNHYAAIVGKESGRYHIKDPTFGDDLWLSADAINTETSGYFLVSANRLGDDWRPVTADESTHVYGMGTTYALDQRATRPYDDKQCCGNQPTKGLAGYSVHSMLVSLNLQDSPVGYTPPRGPAVDFKLTYNQRDAYQPVTFTYSNVGLKWTHSWLSYVTDDPSVPGANVSIYVAGGGLESYSGYSSSTGAFTPEETLAAKLVRISGSPIVYERRFADGSVHIYRESDGAASYPRRIFLNEVRDPAGNALTLHYDSQLRLTSVTDAIGQVTTLTYGDVSAPLKITRVTDPFGRSANLGYDSNGRLAQITDVIGMSSSFTYDTATFITGLTTPYGTTTFTYSGSGTTRWLEATDPLGATERMETRHAAPGIGSSESPAPTGVSVNNNYLNYRNSFYWDKDAYAAAPGDYTQATLKHWSHLRNATVLTTSSVLDSTKQPGERRVWMRYPGQSSTAYTGTLDKPSVIARVLDNGTTQLTRYVYNTFGRVTQAIDPVGRELDYEYDTNGMDLLTVKRKNGAGFDVLEQYIYNAQHLPLTYSDAAGQTTSYTYNAVGQLTSTTNPLGETTTAEYDSNGYLERTRNDSGAIQSSYTYDAQGRIRTDSDSEGYTRMYYYDDLDRLTRTTYPDGSYEAITYDKLDRAQVRDRLGRITTMTYNAVRQLTQTDEPLPRTLHMEWTAAGRQTALIDGENHPIHWEYDIAGRRTAEVYADSTRKTYAYDFSGRLKSITDPLNQVKAIGYTTDDRVAGFTYTNAVHATPSVSFAYDAVYPRIVSMNDGKGTTSYAYAAAGSLGAEHVLREDGPYPSDDVMAYTYDALGRRATRTIGATYSGGSLTGGELESMSYDNLGRLSDKTNALGEFGFGYVGQSGQLMQRTIAPSGSMATPAMLMTYDSNANDRRLLQIRYAATPAALPGDLLQDFNYQYDTIGRQTQAEEVAYGSGGAISSDRLWDISHDDADRLLTRAPASGAGSGTSWFEYSYDKADNRGAAYLNGPSQTVDYNDLNQATMVNTTAYTYDANGNLLSDGGRTYEWDAENRLIKVTKPGGIGGGIFTYAYDGLNRRIYSSESTNGPLKAYRHLWCDERICQTRLLYSGGSHPGPIGALVGGTRFDEGVALGPVKQIYFRDQLGSIRQTYKRNNGGQSNLIDYGAYGEKVGFGQSASGYGFADMYYDAGAELYLTWNRAYAPQIGRWVSRDPIGVEGGNNLYAYVGGSPLWRVDPTGTSWLELIVPVVVIGGSCAIIGCVKLGIDKCARRFPGHKDPLSPDAAPFAQCQRAVVSACSLGMFVVEPASSAAGAVGEHIGSSEGHEK